MKTLRPYLHIIGSEARVLELQQRGTYTLEDAEKMVNEIRFNRTDEDQRTIRDFYAECKRTVYQAHKAGIIEMPTPIYSHPTL
jgi:uncharacterized short protein YbdD (DUF466 family)